MTSAIETLVLQIEAQANSTKSVYRTMQKLLKELRDNYNVELGCSVNKSADVLKQECKRVAQAFRKSELQEQQPKEQKQAKAKAAKATTHTSAQVETTVAPSEPKQVGLELQLAEAQAEIERLRRELADKTNEVAEYAEALTHANNTIADMRAKAKAPANTVTEANEVTEVEEANEVSTVEEQEEEVDLSDAVDDLVLMLIDGQRDVAVAVIHKVAGRLGDKRGADFMQTIEAMNFVNYSDFGQGIRNLMETYRIKMDWLETAMTIETAARL